MTTRYPFSSDLSADATDWGDPTWYDRLGAWLRAWLARRMGLDPWSAGLLLFAMLFLCAGFAGWCLALLGDAPPLSLPACAALLVPTGWFLQELEVRLRPGPLPRIGARQGTGTGEKADHDPVFWRALRRSGVNVRIARALHAGGIRGRRDAARRTDAELLAIPGVGPRTVARLREVLRQLQDAP